MENILWCIIIFAVLVLILDIYCLVISCKAIYKESKKEYINL